MPGVSSKSSLIVLSICALVILSLSFFAELCALTNSLKVPGLVLIHHLALFYNSLSLTLIFLIPLVHLTICLHGPWLFLVDGLIAPQLSIWALTRVEKVSPASLGEMLLQARAEDVGASTDHSSASIDSQSKVREAGYVVASAVYERVKSPCAIANYVPKTKLT